MAASASEFISCSVCFHDYEESGEHIPRILPCFHTLCEKCIKKMLLRGYYLECPECRAKHPAGEDYHSFQQNKYILIQIRKNPDSDETLDAPRQADKCPEHGKDLLLYCKQSQCLKAICTSCLRSEHRGHDFIEIEEKEKEPLFENIESTKQQLQKMVAHLSEVKDVIEKKTAACVAKLKEKNEEIMKHFDDIIKEAERSGNKDITDQVTALNENLALLGNIKKKTEGAVTTQSDLTKYLKTVTGIKEGVTRELDGPTTYKYPEYRDTPEIVEDIKIMFTQLIARKEMKVEIPKAEEAVRETKKQTVITDTTGKKVGRDCASQREFITNCLKTPLLIGETWYLLDMKWFKQWKRYVAFDCWNTSYFEDKKANPGPIDNRPLLQVGNELKGNLIDELDYVLIPAEGWDCLVDWYGTVDGQKPIARKVIEMGNIVKHRKVKVYV